MGRDELAADRLLKQLIGTGRLTYIATTSGTQADPLRRRARPAAPL